MLFQVLLRLFWLQGTQTTAEERIYCRDTEATGQWGCSSYPLSLSQTQGPSPGISDFSDERNNLVSFLNQWASSDNSAPVLSQLELACGHHRAQRIVRAVKIHCDRWEIHIITYWSKPLECTTPRVIPNVNLTDNDVLNTGSCATLVGTAANRESYACMEVGSLCEFSISSFQFWCQPKTPLKITNK